MQSLRIRADGCGAAEPKLCRRTRATQKPVPMRFFKILRQARVIHARMEIKSEFINIAGADFGRMKGARAGVAIVGWVVFSFWVLSPA